MKIPKSTFLTPALILLSACSQEPAKPIRRDLAGGGERVRPDYNMVVGASQGSQDGDYYYNFPSIGEQLVIYDVNPESFNGQVVCINRVRDLRAFQLIDGIPHMSNIPITPIECDEIMKNLENRGLTGIQDYRATSARAIRPWLLAA